MITHKRLCVLGTMCGGTAFTARQLRARGLDVNHESSGMGEDGVVCGYFCWGLMGRKLGDYTWDHRVHLVRNPLDFAMTGWSYVKTLPKDGWVWETDDPVQSALRYWVGTHENIVSQWRPTHRLRVGSEADFGLLCNSLGVRPGFDLGAVNLEDSKEAAGNPERRRRARWSWEQWRSVDPDWAEQGLAMAHAWGVA